MSVNKKNFIYRFYLVIRLSQIKLLKFCNISQLLWRDYIFQIERFFSH